MVQGRVAVQFVVDKRPSGKGGDTPNVVGVKRSRIGIPHRIELDRPAGDRWLPSTLAQSMQALVGQALAATGVGVARADDPASTANLSVEIRELWVDGYMVYGATAAVDLIVLDPRTQQERLRIPLRRETKTPDSARRTSPECQVGGKFKTQCLALMSTLSELSEDLTTAFAQPGVRAALMGVPPPPGAPPPPPPASD
jgi:hypothetical protein